MAARPRQSVTGARVAQLIVLLVIALLAGGCAQPGRPPVVERSPALSGTPETYVVRPGDTLYSIAWRFGFDYRALARANGIGAPFTIYRGQRLRLATALPRPSGAPSGSTAPAQQAPPRQSAPPVSAPAAGAWQRPTEAPVQRGYGDGNRGIDYRLDSGHGVRAAAAGEVVYAGSGLGGFRHLIIVKHDPTYLSAYSLNLSMRVEEGQQIKAGAILADNDSGGHRPGTLHFEIRRNGAPVDPRTLIGGD
jgi:lipoprotein NlpD